MLCADQHPDYRSIARCRKRHLEALGELFVQALRLCAKAKLVGLGALALDGTKLRANASRHKAMSYERMVKKERELEAEVAEIRQNVGVLLSEAEATDREEDERFGEDGRGDELPDELRRREQRLVVIGEAKAALEAEAAERETARRAELEAEGKQPRAPREGRDAYAPKPTAQRNFTDPESKIMKTSDGSFHQCFNGQAVVDSTAQVIVAAEVSDEAPDARQLEPALCQLDENLEAVDRKLPEGAVLTADAGYFSEDNVEATAEHGSTRTSRPAASSTPSPSCRRRPDRSRRTRASSSGWRASCVRRRAAPSTRGARQSSSRSSDRSTPSKTGAGCSCAASRPPAPSGASSARSTTCSSSTGQAEWRSSRRPEPPRGPPVAPKRHGRARRPPSLTLERTIYRHDNGSEPRPAPVIRPNARYGPTLLVRQAREQLTAAAGSGLTPVWATNGPRAEELAPSDSSRTDGGDGDDADFQAIPPMARPGLEPGTPRFSGIRRGAPRHRKSAANQGVHVCTAVSAVSGSPYFPVVPAG